MLLVKRIFVCDEEYYFTDIYSSNQDKVEIEIYDTKSKKSYMTAWEDLNNSKSILGLYNGGALIYPEYDFNFLGIVDSVEIYARDGEFLKSDYEYYYIMTPPEYNYFGTPDNGVSIFIGSYRISLFQFLYSIFRVSELPKSNTFYITFKRRHTTVKVVINSLSKLQMYMGKFILFNKDCIMPYLSKYIRYKEGK